MMLLPNDAPVSATELVELVPIPEGKEDSSARFQISLVIFLMMGWAVILDT